MNASLRHVMVVLLGCFVLLFVQLNRIQVLQADELAANGFNTRQARRDFGLPRATILSSDGIVIAMSEPTGAAEGFQNRRLYPFADLYAHSVGYVSFGRNSDGVELTYSEEILGRTAPRLTELADLIDQTPDPGTVVLTLDHGLQQTAKEALGDRTGSVVAMDPQTGAILALYSFPSFDPNPLADTNIGSANAAFSELLEADGNPLRARAYRDIKFPGSTFKVITAAAGLEHNLVTIEEPVFPETDSYTPPLTTAAIRNFDGGPCGGDLAQLLVRSCNTAFAELAAETLGPEIMVNQAEAAGFNNVPPFDLPGSVASVFPALDTFGAQLQEPNEIRPAGLYENTPKLAQASIGQNDVAATPLQMALMIAGVANDGVIPIPHVLAEVRDVEGDVIDTFDVGDGWRQSMEPENAANLAAALIEADEVGGAASVDGLEIGVKTGTAQLGTDPPRTHAWIVGFAGRPGEDPQIAVAVLVEGQEGSADQTGGGVAGPIARDLFIEFFDSAEG